MIRDHQASRLARLPDAGDQDVLSVHQARDDAEHAAVGAERECVPDVPSIQLDAESGREPRVREDDLDVGVAAADQVRPIGQRPDLEDPALVAGVIAAALVFALDER